MMVDLCKLIEWIIELGVADEIDVYDFEDCLIDYMEYNFSLIISDNSAKEVILSQN